MNFHKGWPEHAVARDIRTLSPGDLARDLGLKSVASSVDVIVGGPPCQAFARVGRSKLREIDRHPEAFRPLALLMENVPDVLNHGGRNIAEEICEGLEDKGYVARYTLLNAAFYSVPPRRERI